MADIYLECKLSQKYMPENIPGGLAHLLIKIKSDNLIKSGRLTLNLGIVIDVSASMKGDKIKFAREAARRIVESLDEKDTVSVVIFSDNARAIVHQCAAEERAYALEAIDKIGPVSGTRMYTGMEKGLIELNKTYNSKSINLMIILTDGETDGENRCFDIAGQIAACKIMISAFGIGETYNEDLLKTMADMTLGRVYHLNNPEQLIKQFETEVASVRSAVITNANLNISVSEGVSIAEINRIYPSSSRLSANSQSGGKTYTITIGNMGTNELPVYGVKLNLPSKTKGSSKIADINMSYEVPGLSIQEQTPKYEITVEYSDNKNLCSMADGEVLSYFNQLNVEGLVSQAVGETKRGNIAQATMILSQARLLTQKLGNTALTQSISKASEQLADKGNLTPEIMKTIKIGATHTVKMADFDKKIIPGSTPEQGKDHKEQSVYKGKLTPETMKTIKIGVPNTLKMSDFDKKATSDRMTEQGRDQMEIIKCKKCGSRNKQGVMKCLYCGSALNQNVNPEPVNNPLNPINNPTVVVNKKQQHISSIESPTVKSAHQTPPIINPPEVNKKVEQQIPPNSFNPTVVVPSAHIKKPMQRVEEPILSGIDLTKQPLAKLVIRQGVRRNHVFAITPGIMTIGRWDPENASFPEIDLTEDDHDLFVSRKHAQITFKDGDYYIEDLGSANCTYINKKMKLTPGNTHKLQNGDEIIIGKITLGFLNDG
jgi:Ca-activated chloride channel family protein